MRGFRAVGGGAVVGGFEEHEAELVAGLATQLIQLLSGGGEAERDRALARLLPDAYRDDATASAEFRRFTEGGLTDRKRHNANLVIDSLAGWSRQSPEVRLTASVAQAWLRTLTDLRLTLASRLGIETDADAAAVRPGPMHDLYDWLGFVQESLVTALGQPTGTTEDPC